MDATSTAEMKTDGCFFTDWPETDDADLLFGADIPELAPLATPAIRFRMVSAAAALRGVFAAGTAALALALFSSPADAVTIVHKGDTITGAFTGDRAPQLWQPGLIWRYHPVWADQAKTVQLPGAVCVFMDGYTHDRDGDCMSSPVTVPPIVPPIIPPIDPPSAIPLPASGLLLLGAVLGFFGLRRKA